MEEINRIDNWANVGSDNGLFDKQKEVDETAFEDIQTKLKDARISLNQGNLEEANYNTSLVYEHMIELCIRHLGFGDFQMYMLVRYGLI